ncbi:hypothetical protein Bbelb_120440 [Branchiostoma belcheri]|nr:hypothetical protein Bbelb_120440 [Branchiostoma belcheri]
MVIQAVTMVTLTVAMVILTAAMVILAVAMVILAGAMVIQTVAMVIQTVTMVIRTFNPAWRVGAVRPECGASVDQVGVPRGGRPVRPVPHGLHHELLSRTRGEHATLRETKQTHQEHGGFKADGDGWLYHATRPQRRSNCKPSGQQKTAGCCRKWCVCTLHVVRGATSGYKWRDTPFIRVVPMPAVSPCLPRSALQYTPCQSYRDVCKLFLLVLTSRAADLNTTRYCRAFTFPGGVAYGNPRTVQGWGIFTVQTTRSGKSNSGQGKLPTQPSHPLLRTDTVDMLWVISTPAMPTDMTDGRPVCYIPPPEPGKHGACMQVEFRGSAVVERLTRRGVWCCRHGERFNISVTTSHLLPGTHDPHMQTLTEGLLNYPVRPVS